MNKVVDGIVPLMHYSIPLVFRLVSTPIPFLQICLGLIPSLSIQFFSIALPHIIKNMENEHEFRHFVYAIAFLVASATNIHWRIAYDTYPILIFYSSFGTFVLLWFVASHMFENRIMSSVHTHQGDLAVLPLTLVAIATFSNDIPLETVRAGRSILFFVPVIVAWATLFLIAYNGFIVSKTTTLNECFYSIVLFSLPIASAHLTLIEMAASPVYYIIFPFSAAFVAQFSFRPFSPPCMKSDWIVSSQFIALFTSISVSYLLTRGETNFVVLIYPLLIVSCVGSFPKMCGETWVMPSTLHVSLLFTLFALRNKYDRVWTENAIDILGIVSITFFSLLLVSFIVGDVTQTQHPDIDVGSIEPSRNGIFSKVCHMFSFIPFKRDGVLKIFDRGKTSMSKCSINHMGVWWMIDSGFPMALICVENEDWCEKRVALKLSKICVRDATIVGWVLGFLQNFQYVVVYTQADDSWEYHDTYTKIFFLKIFRRNMWLYKKEKDVVYRIIFDTKGKICFSYKAVRLNNPFHMRHFLQEKGGMGYLRPSYHL